MLPSKVELFDLDKDPGEQENVAAAHPDIVAALQRRVEALATGAAKPLFLADQFKVVMRNMNGEPLMPGDDGFGDVEGAPAARRR